MGGRVVAKPRIVMVESEHSMNMKRLTRTTAKPRSGDFFAIALKNERFLFGRVINTDAISGLGVPGAILIYIYDTQSKRKELPDRIHLRPDRLLVSPMMTNQLPWTRGYFETVDHAPLQDEDVLGQHCFLSARGTYFDEKGNKLGTASEPVGDYGLHSYRSIDDEISGALGLAE